MLLANLYLLCWDYNRLKYILSFKPAKEAAHSAKEKPLSNKFPSLFFGSVIAMIAAVIVINVYLYDIRPGNSPEECTNGCPGDSNSKACEEFCDCIYGQGRPLHDCLMEYNKAKANEPNQ